VRPRQKPSAIQAEKKCFIRYLVEMEFGALPFVSGPVKVVMRDSKARVAGAAPVAIA
jgi:hypothetical protein